MHLGGAAKWPLGLISVMNFILSNGAVILGLAAVFNASVALTDMGIYG
jgi:hypothetical protein